MNAQQIATAVAELAAERKADDIVTLDLRKLTSLTDYFVICTGRSDRQARAIYEGIRQGMKQLHGVTPTRFEGAQEGRWITIDYVDVIVHVFTPELRAFYALEQLWGEAPAQHFELAGSIA